MSRAIRFTKLEKEALERASEVMYDRGKENKSDATFAKRLEKLLEKMRVAEQPVDRVAPGLGWRKFADICKNVLAERLVIPATVTEEYAVAVSKIIRFAGLTEDQALNAALAARRKWRGPVKLESIARQANALLNESGDDDGRTPPSGGTGRWTTGETSLDELV